MPASVSTGNLLAHGTPYHLEGAVLRAKGSSSCLGLETVAAAVEAFFPRLQDTLPLRPYICLDNLCQKCCPDILTTCVRALAFNEPTCRALEAALGKPPKRTQLTPICSPAYCALPFQIYHASRESFLYLHDFYLGEVHPADRSMVQQVRAQGQCAAGACGMNSSSRLGLYTAAHLIACAPKPACHLQQEPRLKGRGEYPSDDFLHQLRQYTTWRLAVSGGHSGDHLHLGRSARVAVPIRIH
eukprot:scaffold163521_cov20-Tisochrysis_lutea.AAC.1